MIMLFARDAIDDGVSNPRGHILSVVSIVFVTLSTLLVVMRMASIRQRPWGFDDVTIIIASAIAVVLTVLYNKDVQYGWGIHKSEISKAHLETALRIFYVNQILYKISTSLTKLSILALYLRIFPDPSFEKATWVTIFIVAGYGTATTLVSIFSCTPIEKAWIKSTPGTCVNSGAFWYSTAALVIATDMMLIILPLREVWKLHMPSAQKYGLIFLFGLGFFVMITTVIRIIYLNPATSSSDTTYYQSASNTWTSIEVNTGIICACIPTLKRPIAALFPRLFYKSSPSLSQQYRHRSGPRPEHASRVYTIGSPINITSDPASGGRTWTRESDEEVMLHALKEPGGITKTVDVEIAREEHSVNSMQ